MTIPFRARGLTLAMVAALSAIGCGKDNNGPDPDPDPDPALTLFVTPQPDANFATNGEVVFDLMPRDATGAVLLDDQWTVTVTVTQPSSPATTATFLSTTRSQPDPTPVAAVLHIDDSNSMNTNDPNRIRADAAELFWQTLLGQQPGSLVALVDWGVPTAKVTPGFDRTQLLQALTSDQAALAAQKANLVAVVSPGSPLFRSGAETITYLDTTIPTGTFNRVLVTITDGIADEPEFQDDMIAAATATNTRIFAVGLGPASDADPNPDPTAVQNLMSLASATNGIYGGAASANTLEAIFESLATSQIQSKLLSRFDFNPVPPPGTVVTGTITLNGPKGMVSTTYTFTAP